MLQRLDVKDGENAEDVRRKFDGDLGVGGWVIPGREEAAAQRPRIEGAPAWWVDDEEASSSFLKAQGVIL